MSCVSPWLDATTRTLSVRCSRRQRTRETSSTPHQRQQRVGSSDQGSQRTAAAAAAAAAALKSCDRPVAWCSMQLQVRRPALQRRLPTPFVAAAAAAGSRRHQAHRRQVTCRAAPVGTIRETDGSPEAAAMAVLQLLAARRLDGLLPWLSEIAVVKAVVRQHHARVTEHKQLERRHLQQQAEQEQRQQQQQGSGGLAPYDSYGSYDGVIAPHAASHSSVPRWQEQAAPPYTPPRPSCPVPGAQSPDYAREYESFNMQHRPHGASTPPQERAQDSPSPPPPPPQQQEQEQPLFAARAPAPAQGAPDFLAVLDAAQAGDAAHHLLDSYAMRHLVLSRPAQLEPLSSMRLSGEQYVLRCRSTSLWGEKVVLTLTLRKRSEAELKSTYSKQPLKQPWVLMRVTGEPACGDRLEAISPDHPPEAVVAAQVEALRECDFDVAYALTSPVGRAVAGTRDRFRAALQGDFRYQPLLMHGSAATVHRTHSNANTYLEVLDVTGPPGTGSSLYIWVATRQPEGLYRNCWLVEYVTPINDPSVIKALQLGGL